MSKIIIAIDGHSSCGKSSTAKKVAERLDYHYIDTGAMYRSVTLFFVQNNIDITQLNQVTAALESIEISVGGNSDLNRNDTYLNGTNVENEIRKMYISEKVSIISSIKEVRYAMVKQQQKIGTTRGIVMDGRDIGTIVFPDAELKIFMTANPNIRAKRRQLELEGKKEVIDLKEILENLHLRDHLDVNRSESPLRQAADSVYLDNSELTMEEQVEIIISLAMTKINSLTI